MKKAEALMKFIDKSPSVYHAIKNAGEFLEAKGFVHLNREDTFELKPQGRYFVTNNGSALIAWQMPKSGNAENGFRIVGSHSDSPTFRIKPNPEIKVNNHYLKLNTEGYGGVILSTWFDRPLSAAGRVIIKTDDLLKPEVKLINFDKNLLTIPSLAIHMNREINDGYKFNKQKDTLPLIALINEKLEEKGFLINLIAEEAGVTFDKILDFDLYLYDRQPGCFIGANDEFFSVGRIDNLGMACASIDALGDALPSNFVQVAAIFDNEEVGSRTAQGAGSPFLHDTLQRIIVSTSKGNAFEELQKALAKSFLISADQAHALHPNYTEKNDITNFPLMNKGPAIKVAASMSYTTDGISAAIFRDICARAKVPCQNFVNRSDMAGGSTIGPISVSNLNIKSVDIGNPILGMHSVRELGGTEDQEYITKAFAEFYK